MKSLVVGVLTVLSLPCLVFAQTDNIAFEISANVKSSIEIETIRNMSFGKVQPDQQIIELSPIYDTSAGAMKAMGVPNAEIRITFPEQRTLTHAEGNSQLVFHYNVSGNNSDNQETSELIDMENRDTRLNDNGEFYFWIGGNVNISNAIPGQYLGDFTIEVEYL